MHTVCASKCVLTPDWPIGIPVAPPVCSCRLQSGRLPVHVNMVNLAPNVWNPSDPVSGFAAIPRNMTGIATKMKEAGYGKVASCLLSVLLWIVPVSP